MINNENPFLIFGLMKELHEGAADDMESPEEISDILYELANLFVADEQELEELELKEDEEADLNKEGQNFYNELKSVISAKQIKQLKEIIDRYTKEK